MYKGKIKYNVKGKTRDKHLAPDLENILKQVAYKYGWDIRVNSGGQSPKGKGKHTGSDRHDHGHAGDVEILDAKGNAIDIDKHKDKVAPFFSDLVAAGVTSIGYDPGYMGRTTFHADNAVAHGQGVNGSRYWGKKDAKGKRLPAPKWVRSAVDQGYSAPNSAAAKITSGKDSYRQKNYGSNNTSVSMGGVPSAQQRQLGQMFPNVTIPTKMVGAENPMIPTIDSPVARQRIKPIAEGYPVTEVDNKGPMVTGDAPPGQGEGISVKTPDYVYDPVESTIPVYKSPEPVADARPEIKYNTTPDPELDYSTKRSVGDKMLPFLSNVVNAFQKPPAVPRPLLGTGLQLDKVNMDNDRNEVRRASRAANLNLDRSLDANSAAAAKSNVLAQRFAQMSKVNQAERNQNVRIGNREKMYNNQVNMQNLRMLNQANDREVERQTMQQRNFSANIANAGDKLVQMSQADRIADMEARKLQFYDNADYTGATRRVLAKQYPEKETRKLGGYIAKNIPKRLNYKPIA